MCNFKVELKVNDSALPAQGPPGANLLPLTLSMRATTDLHCARPQAFDGGFALDVSCAG